MIHPLTVLYVLCAALFAGVHMVAMEASLYWYHWWFDIVMHLWGGLLIGSGVHTLCTFSRVTLRPTLPLVLLILVLVTGAWEVFERIAGLYNPDTYIFDTAKDVAVGFSGGLLAHLLLRNYTIG